MPEPLDFDKILGTDKPEQVLSTPGDDLPEDDKGAQVEEQSEATADKVEDAPEATAGEGKSAPPADHKSSAQRISELHAKRREVERENRELREQLVQRGAPREPTLAELHPSQFQSVDQYNDAVRNAAFREASVQAEQRVAVQATEQAKESFYGKLASDGKDIDGFTDVLRGIQEDPDYLHISVPMGRYLMKVAKHPAPVLKWLADNPDEAERIYGLESEEAIAELVHRDGLAGRRGVSPVSRAPAPTPTVSGSGSSPLSLERMNHAQLLEWTREQRRK